MFSDAFSSFLNLVRWLAAFLVVIGHARHLIFVEYDHVFAPNLLIKALYFLTSLGHQAVMVFFVISGFLVGGLTLRRWQSTGKSDLLEYGAARFSRIYTALIPALILGAAVDFIGLKFFNDSSLYTNSVSYQSSMNYVVADTLNVKTFLGNVLMMQGIIVDRLGSNAPLWSLANEWWYYSIFGLIAAGIFARGVSRLILVFSGLAIACLLPANILLWMMVWLLGVVASIWIRYNKGIPHPLLGLTIFIGALVLTKISHKLPWVGADGTLMQGFATDFMFGAAFAIFLVAASRTKTGMPFPRVQHALAEFSYTTYLFHFPLMVLVSAIAYKYFDLKIQVQPDLRNLAEAVFVVLLVWPMCFLSSLFFERRTNDVRKYVLGMLRRF